MIHLIRAAVAAIGVYSANSENNSSSSTCAIAQNFIENGDVSAWYNPYSSITEPYEMSRWNITEALPVELGDQVIEEEKPSFLRFLGPSPSAEETLELDYQHQIHNSQYAQLIADNPRQLDESLCEIGKPYIDKSEFAWWFPGSLWWLPRASDGHIDVRLQESVVIKQTGDWEARTRMRKAKYARNICEKNGYQLEIPTSCIYKGKAIDKRIHAVSTRESARFSYYQNPTAFTKSVEDFTGFLMQTTWSDLISFRPILSRDDNVVSYLEDTDSGPVGKIALVDLEHLEFEPCKSPVMAYMIAIAFFPHHYENILKVAKQFFPSIETYRGLLDYYSEQFLVDGVHPRLATLETFKDDALKDHSSFYTGQWDLLKSNNITYQNIDFMQPIIYSPEREINLEEKIQKSWSDYIHDSKNLLTLSINDFSSNSEMFYLDLTGRPTCAAKLNFQEISTRLFGPDRPLIQILESLGKIIHKQFMDNINKVKADPDMSFLDIANQRKVKLVLFSDLESALDTERTSEQPYPDFDLRGKIASLLPPTKSGHSLGLCNIAFIHGFVIPKVLEDLQKHGNIGHFRKGDYKSGSPFWMTRDYHFFV